MVQRGDQVRSVGRDLYAHWGCVARHERPARPRAIVQRARKLSWRTELRRQVFWAVTCPTCGAEPGQGCKSEARGADGQPYVDSRGVRLYAGQRLRNHQGRVLLYSRLKRLRKVTADATVLAALRALARALAPWRPRSERPVVDRVAVEAFGESSGAAWGPPLRT